MIEIGRSGGSETFFAEVHPKRSPVFLFDRSTGTLHFMASSVSVFAHLNDLAEQYDAYCDARDLDGEEVDAKRIAGSPTLTALLTPDGLPGGPRSTSAAATTRWSSRSSARSDSRRARRAP